MAEQQAVPAGHADSAAREATLPETHAKASFWTLMLGAIGVVFGDIGTSPLYAFKESVAAAAAGGPVTRDIILGVLSLILWSLVLVVTVKYVVILLRADNKGEGGTLTLVALTQRAVGQRGGLVLMLGIVGAGLFYGDAVLTPAISVLSAVEGMKLVAPDLESYVVPVTLVILIALFLVQSRGTGKVAAFFGPIMLVWFATLAIAGGLHIADDPTVLTAINPLYSIMFFVDHPSVSLAVLGAVCLAVTGAEALYADLGHFGAAPIRSAWLYLVFPALVINYFGQGALVLSHPETAESPLFHLVPEWALPPMIVLAMLATIIASQAVITGAFSLTRQAVQLGILPRMEIRFTSEAHQGQIFLPRVNYLLLFGVIVLVLIFGSSSNLSHAYGVSVFGAMSVDAVLAIILIRKGWRWSLGLTLAVMLPFLFIDLAFFGANLLKLFTGGYVPVILASVLIVTMWTWVKGTSILFEKTRKVDVPPTQVEDLADA